MGLSQLCFYVLGELDGQGMLSFIDVYFIHFNHLQFSSSPFCIVKQHSGGGVSSHVTPLDPMEGLDIVNKILVLH